MRQQSSSQSSHAISLARERAALGRHSSGAEYRFSVADRGLELALKRHFHSHHAGQMNHIFKRANKFIFLLIHHNHSKPNKAFIETLAQPGSRKALLGTCCAWFLFSPLFIPRGKQCSGCLHRRSSLTHWEVRCHWVRLSTAVSPGQSHKNNRRNSWFTTPNFPTTPLDSW